MLNGAAYFDLINFTNNKESKFESTLLSFIGGEEGFDPSTLRTHFLDTIKSLQKLSEQTDGQIAKLERLCKDQEQKHKEKCSDVEKKYKGAMTKFHDLDDRINSVATKVVHLGVTTCSLLLTFHG